MGTPSGSAASGAQGVPDVRLRPCTADDLPSLYEVYASTRAEELARAPWDAAQKAAFLRMQFDAQHRHYQQHYAGASFDVVLVGGEPAGRLYVARGREEYVVIDIALLPALRGGGIGTKLLREVAAEADAQGARVTLHVERFNPARALYERLGFAVVADEGVYLRMERATGGAGST